MKELPENYKLYLDGIEEVSDARLARNAKMLSTAVLPEQGIEHADVLLVATQAEIERRQSQQ